MNRLRKPLAASLLVGVLIGVAVQVPTYTDEFIATNEEQTLINERLAASDDTSICNGLAFTQAECPTRETVRGWPFSTSADEANVRNADFNPGLLVLNVGLITFAVVLVVTEGGRLVSMLRSQKKS